MSRLEQEISEIRLEAFTDLVTKTMDDCRDLAVPANLYPRALAKRILEKLESGDPFGAGTEPEVIHQHYDETKNETEFSFRSNVFLVKLMAANFADFLRDGRAPNYVTMTLDHDEVGPMAVTIQRLKGGKSPHELREDAERRRDDIGKAFGGVYEFAWKLWHDPLESEAANKMGERMCDFIVAHAAKNDINLPEMK